MAALIARLRANPITNVFVIVLSPVVEPIVAAVKTVVQLVQGNVKAILAEPLVVGALVISAVNAVATGSKWQVYAAAAITAILRRLVSPVVQSGTPNA